MADKVGEIYYEAHVRGDSLNRELKRVGQKAGDQFGDEFSKSAEKRLQSSFSKLSNDLLPHLRKQGRISAAGFTDAFENVLVSRIRSMQSEVADIFAKKNGLDEFAKGFKDADEAVGALRLKLQELSAEGGINEQMYRRLGGTLNQWLGETRKAEEAQKEELNTRRESIDLIKQELSERSNAIAIRKAEADFIRGESINALKQEMSERSNAFAIQKAESDFRRNEAIEGLQMEIRERERMVELDRIQTEQSKNRYKGIANLTALWKKHTSEVQKTGNASEGAGRRLSRITKIVLAVTAALPQLILLSSAAGAGLTILGGAAAAGVAGLVAGVFAVIGLNKELSELPEAIRPAAAAFQGFTDVAKNAKDALQTGAASGLAAGFTSLQGTLNALMPTITAFGEVVGRTFATFTAGLAPGTAGFERLKTVIDGMAPIFEGLVGVLSNIGAALGNVFIVIQPYIMQFVGYLDQITQAFADWSGSAEGREQITIWAQNAESIFKALADLIGSLGTMFADIITPTLVSQFTTFIYSLSNFIPTLGNIIKLVEGLRIFDVIAALFNAITPVVDALMPSLLELANVIGGALVGGLNTIRPFLTQLAEGLAPILTALTPIIPLIVDLATTLISELVPAIMPLLGVIAELVGIIVESLGPAIEPLIASFLKLVEPILAIATSLLNILMPIIEPLLGLIGALGSVVLDQLLIPLQLFATVLMALEPLLTIIMTLVGAFIETLVALITGDFQKIPTIWEDAWKVMSDAVQAMVDFVKPLWDGIVGFIQTAVTNIGSFIGTQLFMIKTGWESIWNGILSFMRGIWNGILGLIEGGINGTVDLINGLLKGINSVDIPGVSKIGLLPKVRLPRLASGTIAYGRMQAIIGEAGPEAVVPLNRPLSQVDPAVRDLSAYAQGKTVNNNAPTKQVNIEAGAIQVVTPARNPALVASMVIDEITENALN